MDRDTIVIILEGAILVAVLAAVYFAYRRRRLRAKRRMILELLKEYFQNGMTADQLERRMREVADRRFWGAPMFYGLTVAAFQGAVDAKLARQAYSEEDERKLMSMLADAKRRFGLTDRYQIEGWRAGRE
jgi:hypothetical protein